MNAQSLWNQFSDAGLVTGAMPVQDNAPQPWYVRTMLMFSGWLGALFLFGFVGALMAFAVETAVGALIVGAIVLTASRIIFRLPKAGDFVAQFGLAAALAGQILLTVGFAKLLNEDKVLFWLVLTAVEIALIALLPNFLHRVACTLMGAFALGMASYKMQLPYVSTAALAAAFAGVWLAQSRWGKHVSLWEAVGIGLGVSLALWDVQQFLDFWALQWGPVSYRGLMFQIGKVGMALVFVAAVWRLTVREGVSLDSAKGRLALVGAVLLAAASWVAPGLLPSTLVALLGFACGSRFLLGVGLIGLIAFVSRYYYSLETTLLVKSGLLAAAGAVLLAARMFLPDDKGVRLAEQGDHHA
jgi:hypothetical protein